MIVTIKQSVPPTTREQLPDKHDTEQMGDSGIALCILSAVFAECRRN